MTPLLILALFIPAEPHPRNRWIESAVCTALCTVRVCQSVRRVAMLRRSQGLCCVEFGAAGCDA